MRILITNTGPWGTGSFNVVSAIVRELTNIGHEVKVVFPDADIDSADKQYYLDHPDIYEIWQFPRQQGDIKLTTFSIEQKSRLDSPSPLIMVGSFLIIQLIHFGITAA